MEDTVVVLSPLAGKVLLGVLALIAVGALYLLYRTGRVQAYKHVLPSGKKAITAHFASPPEYKTFFLKYDPSLFDFEECIVSEYRGAFEPTAFTIGKPAPNEWVAFSHKGGAIGWNRRTDMLWKMNVTFVNPSVDSTGLKGVEFQYLKPFKGFSLWSLLSSKRQNMTIESKILEQYPPPAL